MVLVVRELNGIGVPTAVIVELRPGDMGVNLEFADATASVAPVPCFSDISRVRSVSPASGAPALLHACQ